MGRVVICQYRVLDMGYVVRVEGRVRCTLRDLVAGPEVEVPRLRVARLLRDARRRGWSLVLRLRFGSFVLSEVQRRALSLMSDRNIGAVMTKRGWVWPEGVRLNEDAARAVIKVLGGAGS